MRISLKILESNVINNNDRVYPFEVLSKLCVNKKTYLGEYFELHQPPTHLTENPTHQITNLRMVGGTMVGDLQTDNELIIDGILNGEFGLATRANGSVEPNGLVSTGYDLLAVDISKIENISTIFMINLEPNKHILRHEF
jgi:hypothetical protein